MVTTPTTNFPGKFILLCFTLPGKIEGKSIYLENVCINKNILSQIFNYNYEMSLHLFITALC